MTKQPVKDVAASVPARLLALSRERREDFQLVLTRFSIERLLYRLASSKQAERFVLKGAMLFAVWTEQPRVWTGDSDDATGFSGGAAAAGEAR